MPDRIPRYYFSREYQQFYDYLLLQPHVKRTFRTGEYLWAPNEPLEKVYYICSGVAQTYVEHEDGHRKILSFHGAGTVFPGCQKQSFKIERSIITIALSDLQTLEFTKDNFYQLFQSNAELNAQVLEWYAMYINLLVYEAAHQEYNNTFLKLCNLLYLLSQNNVSGEQNRVNLTQESLADLLAVNRVHVAKNLSRLREEHIILSHRKWIEIIDFPTLIDYCSLETLQG